MSFRQRETMLNQIQSEIKKSHNNISRLISKKELKNNKFVKDVNEKLITYQKKILEEKILQINHIDLLIEYLGKNTKKSEQKKIIFQQKKILKLRSKLKKEIQKWTK